MKILLVADKLDIGGAETHIYELSRSLLRFGHSVALLSAGGKTARLIKSEGAITFEFAPDSDFTVPSPKRLARLLSLLREYKPDVVHAHTRKALFLCKTAQRIIPFPLVFTAHAKFSTGGFKGFFTRIPPFCIAVSSDIKKHFAKCFKADEKSITVIENGIDTDRFSPIEKGAELNILTVSRLDRDCSLSARLLCILAPRLASKHPNITVTIVGGGSALPEIKALALKANQMAGRQVVSCVGSSDSIPKLLGKCSLFVGVSRAALEAMSCDKPVIICGNEGYLGICRQNNFKIAASENFCARGHGVPNAEQLLLDIEGILSAPHRQELKLRKKILSEYRSDKMAENTLTVYRKALCAFRAEQKHGVLLCGYYGFGNAGDELVRERITKSLAPMKVTVIGAKGEGRIWRFNIPRIFRAVKNSSGVILGGGSLLQNATSRRSLWYYLTILKIADLYGKRVMLYANGVGPIYGKNAEKACAAALKRVDYASARDSVSFEMLKKLLPENTVLRLSCDPALAPAKPLPPQNRILCFLRGADIDYSLQKALSELSMELDGTPLVFACMNAKQDKKATARLAYKLGGNSSVADVSDLKGLSELIGSSELVISSRLHALIIAASHARPFVALCRDPKLSAFAKDCRLPPVLDVCLDAPRLTQRLKESVSLALSNEKKLSSHLQALVSETSKQAESDKAQAFHLFS